MIYCFDVDGTLLEGAESGDYESARPIPGRVEAVNRLIDEGHEVRIYTARGSETGMAVKAHHAGEQLRNAGLRWDGVVHMKPYADVYVDDHAVSDTQFFDDTGSADGRV